MQSGSGHGGAALAGPFTAAQRGGLLTMEPVREARMLRLLWEVEKEEAYVQSRATRLASAVLGSEVEGSLHWLLTRHLRPPLATSVSAGVSYSFSDSSLFSVAVSLTPEGLARHEEVSELVYGAIHLLRETAAAAPSGGGGLPPHVRAERATMARLAFEFADEAEPLGVVKALASRMHTPGLAPSQILSRPYSWPDEARAHPAPLRELLELLTPRRALTLLVGPRPETRLEAPLQERWYGTPYGLQPVADEALTRLAEAAPHPDLRLPPPNPYVPDSFQLLEPPPPAAAAAAPPAEEGGGRRRRREPTELASGAAGVRAWHLGVGGFARPKASALVLLRTPAAAGTARRVVLSSLAAELLDDTLGKTPPGHLPDTS